MDEAFKLAERARRLVPQDPVVLSTWGFLQLARGKVNEAITVLIGRLCRIPREGNRTLGRGWHYFGVERPRME